MGAGGRMSLPPKKKEEKEVLQRVPHTKPPFTLSQLKKAIPPHCFERSLIRSYSYVAYDYAIVFSLYYVAANYFPLLPRTFSYLAWPLYWFLQGCVLSGLWVIAHECGHNALSYYPWLDDTVGLIIHSSFLVPYFSWKYSHRRHHSNAGSLDRDEAAVPNLKSDIPWFFNYFNNPPGRVLQLILTFLLGLPMYLACNATGRRYDRLACHFDPYSPMYNDRERLQIYLSDVGVLAVTYGLYKLAAANGITWLFCVYGGPLLVVNSFLVVVTLLQHTHPSIPRYHSSEWDWLRGSLSTCDRDYGVLNKVLHNATDAHLIHHLFYKIPHYHAVEATNAIKPILKEYYLFDATPFYKALWRETKECLYVAPDEDSLDKGVFWYNNKI